MYVLKAVIVGLIISLIGCFIYIVFIKQKKMFMAKKQRLSIKTIRKGKVMFANLKKIVFALLVLTCMMAIVAKGGY